jgi:hypothetical protein
MIIKPIIRFILYGWCKQRNRLIGLFLVQIVLLIFLRSNAIIIGLIFIADVLLLLCAGYLCWRRISQDVQNDLQKYYINNSNSSDRIDAYKQLFRLRGERWFSLPESDIMKLMSVFPPNDLDRLSQDTIDLLSALPEPGLRVLVLLHQKRNPKGLHYPHEVVSIDPPVILFKDELCSVVRDDYFAPCTCDGDYNKTKYDGCEFMLSLLLNAVVQLQFMKTAIVYGEGLFIDSQKEWGYGWDDSGWEKLVKSEIKVGITLSKNMQKVALTLSRGIREDVNSMREYATIERIDRKRLWQKK